MSSGLEAEVALDVAVVLTLGLNRVLGKAGQAAGKGAEVLAALAANRAEDRATALADAQAYDSALRAVLDRNARIAVLAEAGGDVPEPLMFDGQGAAELAAWCAAADQELDQAERRLAERTATEMAAEIFHLPVGALVTAPEPVQAAAPEPVQERHASVPRNDEAAAPAAGRQRAAALVRVLARMPADTAAADRQHVAQAAARVADATTASEAEGLLTEVRLRVQQASARTQAHRDEARRRAEELEAAEQAEAERLFILDRITGAFGELGYEVDTGFETLTARDGAVVLSRDGWPDHAVRMRVEDGGQVRAALVRTAEPRNEEERRKDTEREAEWCVAFETARTRLEHQGVRADVRWQIDPGDQRLPVVPEARQTRTRGKPREKQREREQ